jgi:predicted transcriptional regulator
MAVKTEIYAANLMGIKANPKTVISPKTVGEAVTLKDGKTVEEFYSMFKELMEEVNAMKKASIKKTKQNE